MRKDLGFWLVVQIPSKSPLKSVGFNADNNLIDRGRI
jgi:hypothetical protein